MQSGPHGRESSMQQQPTDGTASGAVYVQTNAAPNEVISFRRAADGSLDRIGSVIASDGSLSLEDATAGVAVDGQPGLRDEELSGDGRFLCAIYAG